MLRHLFVFSLLPHLAHAQDLLEPLIVYGDRLHTEELTQEGTIIIADEERISSSGRFTRDALLPALGGYVGNPRNGNFSLRGLSAENILGAFGTRSNSILIPFVDGVPQSAATNRYFPRLLMDTAQVSISKGGQSTNYGPNSLGGVILYQDYPPSFDNSGNLRVEYAQRNSLHLGLSQNLVLLEDTLAARFSYQRVTSDGHYTNTFTDNDEWGKTDRNFFKGQLLWKQSEDTSLLAVVEYDESRSNPFATSKAFANFTPEDRRTDENTRTLFPAERWLGSLTLDHVTPNNLRLKNTLGFSSLDVDGLTDLDGGNFFSFFANTLIDETHYTNDFSLSGDIGNHVWTVGSFLQRSDYEVNLNGVLSGFPFLTQGEEDVETYSLYGKFDYNFANHWHLIGGARLNHEERDLTATASSFGRPITVTRDSNSYTDLLPSLTLSWNDEEHWHTGLKLSRNYRGGGVSYAPSFGFVQSFDPEYSNDAELFIRYRKDERLTISGAIYFAKHTDMQVPVQVPGGLADIDTLITNSGEGQRFGAEVAARWQPIDNLFLNLSLNYNETEFTELNLDGVDRSGQDFPNAPQFIGSTSISYQPETGIFGNLQLDAASEAYTQASQPDLTSLESRINLSGRIGFRQDHWEVYVFANNLLDSDYPLGRIDARSLGNGIINTMNAPRTVGAGLALNW